MHYSGVRLRVLNCFRAAPLTSSPVTQTGKTIPLPLRHRILSEAFAKLVMVFPSENYFGFNDNGAWELLCAASDTAPTEQATFRRMD